MASWAEREQKVGDLLDRAIDKAQTEVTTNQDLTSTGWRNISATVGYLTETLKECRWARQTDDERRKLRDIASQIQDLADQAFRGSAYKAEDRDKFNDLIRELGELDL